MKVLHLKLTEERHKTLKLFSAGKGVAMVKVVEGWIDGLGVMGAGSVAASKLAVEAVKPKAVVATPLTKQFGAYI